MTRPGTTGPDISLAKRDAVCTRVSSHEKPPYSEAHGKLVGPFASPASGTNQGSSILCSPSPRPCGFDVCRPVRHTETSTLYTGNSSAGYSIQSLYTIVSR